MYDDEGNYVILPDPDTLPEPYFEGMRGEDIIAECDRLQSEADEWNWQQNQMYLEEQQWLHDNSGWFKDY